MKRVAVLGGGPAGAFAAERLARAGVSTVLIDEKLAWEKPCGGGLTSKAYTQYPFLIENPTPKKVVRTTRVAASRRTSGTLELTRPLVIYSRYELNGMLLDRAAAAGAAIEKTRVTAVERRGNGWMVRTRSGAIDADYCVVATGARNPLREFGTERGPADTMMALGYYVPVERDAIDLQFFRGFEGYIWVFPRRDHLSVGIGGKGEQSQVMRARLETWMAEHGLPLRGSTFFAHVIPSLEKPSWRSNRVAGDGWMAVGDAGGLVDPVTGEGLYYALRSADLAAEALLAGAGGPEQWAGAYRERLRHEFTEDLEAGARLARRLFLTDFLSAPCSQRMVQFMRRSPTLLSVVQDLFAGTQGYLDLKQRLKDNVRKVAWEVVAHTLTGREARSAGLKSAAG